MRDDVISIQLLKNDLAEHAETRSQRRRCRSGFNRVLTRLHCSFSAASTSETLTRRDACGLSLSLQGEAKDSSQEKEHAQVRCLEALRSLLPLGRRLG